VKILVIGYNAFDVIVPVTGVPAADSKTEVETVIHGGGGPGATAAVCLARLGADVRLITMLGDDVGAQIQRQELEAVEVDLTLVQTAPGQRSAQAVIMVDPAQESRAVLWTRGDLPHLDPRSMDPAWLDGCDLLYCDGHEPAATMVLAEAARERDLPVVMDAGTMREGSRELVRVCTDVISSRGFAPALTGESDPRRVLGALRDLGPERVAMTFGEAGVLALPEDGDEVFHVPAYDVDVVDTTGAGDAFHAGYAYSRARGGRWRDDLEVGAAVAALKCRDWGGRRALPYLHEVEQTLDRNARRAETPAAWTP